MPSTASRPISRAVVQALEAEDWRSSIRIVKVEEAQAVLRELDGRDELCPPAVAAQAARSLLGLYPTTRDIQDPDTYAAGLTALMAAYPTDFVKRVVNPVTGLASRLKFVPTLADVREALEAERARRNRILSCAITVIQETEKARQKADDEARWAKQLPPPVERAKYVQRLVRGGIKSTTDLGHTPPQEPVTETSDTKKATTMPQDVNQSLTSQMQRLMSKPLSPEAQAFADDPTEENWKKIVASQSRSWTLRQK